MFSVISFDSNASLKQEEIIIPYGEFSLKIVREKVEKKGKNQDTIALSNQIVIETEKEHEAHVAGRMFLSEFSWLFDVPIYDIMHTGGSIPVKGITKFCGHSAPRVVVDLTRYQYLLLSDEQHLVIGLYREAISSNSVFYKYLGLYNILDIKMKGKEREEWLIEQLEDKTADAKQLASDMYLLGRNMVAHGDIRLDIHTFNDYNRIRHYSATLKPIVRQYLVDEFSIPSLSC